MFWILNNDAMKIYYSHAMLLYGTTLEKIEKRQILKNFPKARIVDPGSFQKNIRKQKEGMSYCLKLVEKCHGLVFTKFLNKITAGVGLEINHAIQKKMPVHELRMGKLRKISKPVAYLSRADTIKLYKIWRFKQLFLS